LETRSHNPLPVFHLPAGVPTNLAYTAFDPPLLESATYAWQVRAVVRDGFLDRTNLLDELNLGDVFWAGDFPVTVTKVSGSNGTFSGAGWTQLPVFRDSKVAIKFDNVQINRDLQLVGGFVATTYDASESQMVDMGYQPGGTGGPTLAWDLEVNAVIPPGGNITYDPETGTLVITDANGNPVGNITLPTDVIDRFNGDEPYEYVVKDANGDTYTITKDEKGNVTTEKVEGGIDNREDSNTSNEQSSQSDDLLLYFKIKKLNPDETVNNEMAENIVRDPNQKYYPAGGEILLDEGKYICIPTHKNISFMNI
jgi:hypothetical protein